MASKKSIKPVIQIQAHPDRVILALEQKGFFVGLMTDGKTSKKEASHAGEFPALVKISTVAWVDYVTDDIRKEAPAIAKELGFSDALIANLLKNPRSGYEDFDTEMGMMIPAIVIEGFDVGLDPLLILVRDNLVATIHTTELRRFFRLRRYAESFMRKIKLKLPTRDKISLILIRIIDENNARNFDHLRQIEENADKLSEQLSDPTTPRQIIGPQIHDMKHALIMYLSGLWETVDVLNTLRYGDPEVLSDEPKLLARVGVLITEVHTQIGLAEHLSNVLASGLEVMQSIYNNQLQVLNNKMAILVAYMTILGTAVLVPNTLATILSNPAYQLTPADAGWYSLLMVLSTFVATFIAYWWVKRKGLLPGRPDAD
ncbi:MAG TPA: CorA family divalent cation transporter [Candidatus Bilamarchaeaceae archaeon]|nr:CorA family divalent cation transporter [Candidatus Bilamarchaeaceae archaeon]